MNRIFTKYGLAVLSVAVLIAILLCVLSIFSASSAVLPNVAGTIATPFRTVGTAIVNKIDEWTNYFTEFDAMEAENEQLKKDLARLEADIRQAEYDREENKLLRELLELTEKYVIVGISGLLVSFPAAASTFAYVYTMDGYMLSLLL